MFNTSVSLTARIDDLSHDGRGVAHSDGKAVFIHGALPGEEVLFKYTARRRSLDEAKLEAVITPAAERVEPRCLHYDICGGCSLQHMDASRQIAVKQDWLLDNLSRIGKVQPALVFKPLTGPYWGYRRKARLGVRYVQKKGRVLVCFRERGGSFLADLRRCEVLHPRVGGLLEDLGKLVGDLSIYRRLPQIEVAVGDDETALSFRIMEPLSETDKVKLVGFGERHNIQIFVQTKGPETTALLGSRRVPLEYRLPEFALTLAFEPYQFTQVNAGINQRMVSRVIELLDVRESDRVLDLFCGLGNFTLALGRRALQVIGVEGEQSLVASAERNARRNGLDNVRFHVADLAGEVRDLPWMQDGYDKILLDPPRSGALTLMPCLAALGTRRIVYVSCHPATLARDAGELVHRFGYKLSGAGVMDMFPHTAHVESIALFER